MGGEFISWRMLCKYATLFIVVPIPQSRGRWVGEVGEADPPITLSNCVTLPHGDVSFTFHRVDQGTDRFFPLSHIDSRSSSKERDLSSD